MNSAHSAHQAKKIAREYENKFCKSNWNDIRVSIMQEVMQNKLLQHEDVRKALLKSGEAEIIENSPTDYFWGCGADGSGHNETGKTWMRIRDKIRASGL